MQLALRVENGRVPAGRGQPPAVKTSAPRSDEGECPQPYRRHPFRRHRAFQGRGSARWSGQSEMRNPAFRAHLRLGPEASQRTELTNGTQGVTAWNTVYQSPMGLN